MIVIDRNPNLDIIVEQIKALLRTDDAVGPTVKDINGVIEDLLHHYQMRSNIVDMEPLISELHKPFYEAFNEILLRFNISELEVINFTIYDQHGTYVLIIP